MTKFTDPHTIYVLVSLTWFSLTDLCYRTAPGVEFFFGGAVLLGVFDDPLRVGVVVLAVAGVLEKRSSILMLPLLLHPSSWMVLLVGVCYRERLVGGADWLALAGVACLFDWYVSVLTLVGVLVWRDWWVRKWSGPVPALPGVFLGMMSYLIFSRLSV